MAGADWSDREVGETVESYFGMLRKQLKGTPFVKTAVNAELVARLDSRSRAAVEFKFQNISAVLSENGWAYVRGYKPMKNVQQKLRYAVERRLKIDAEIDVLMDEVTKMPTVFELLRLPALSNPPEFTIGEAVWGPKSQGIKRDYLYRDVHNRALGLAGEKSVVEFERSRLNFAGKSALANRVEHVSQTMGDGLGYDVLSFDSSGLERFIEVKTTVHSSATPFFISRPEVEASEYFSDQFFIYRLYDFNSRPGQYALQGSVRDSCMLRAETFSAGPKPEMSSSRA